MPQDTQISLLRKGYLYYKSQIGENMINKLIDEMIKYYSKDPKRIQHFMKVHAFSKLIGEMENIDKNILFTLETAAVVHDIGIKSAEEKYGNCSGKYQEKLGSDIAANMLAKLEFPKDIIDRVTYLVGHHHTYTNIDGIDYQILVEADFLVNMYEDELSQAACSSAITKIFKTSYGTKIATEMFMG